MMKRCMTVYASKGD